MSKGRLEMRVAGTSEFAVGGGGEDGGDEDMFRLQVADESRGSSSR